jgi:hypothetical protein
MLGCVRADGALLTSFRRCIVDILPIETAAHRSLCWRSLPPLDGLLPLPLRGSAHQTTAAGNRWRPPCGGSYERRTGCSSSCHHPAPREAPCQGDLRRPRAWFHKWWRRYLDCGTEGLYDLTRANHRAQRIPPELDRTILSIRRRLQAHAVPATRYSLVGPMPSAPSSRPSTSARSPLCGRSSACSSATA